MRDGCLHIKSSVMMEWLIDNHVYLCNVLHTMYVNVLLYMAIGQYKTTTKLTTWNVNTPDCIEKFAIMHSYTVLATQHTEEFHGTHTCKSTGTIKYEWYLSAKCREHDINGHRIICKLVREVEDYSIKMQIALMC